MNRRGFLKGAVLVTTLAVVGVEARPAPVIYGDGIHDDHAGLQAAFDGKPFKDMSGCVTRAGNGVSVVGGRFQLSRPLVIGGSGHYVVHNCFDCRGLRFRLCRGTR